MVTLGAVGGVSQLCVCCLETGEDHPQSEDKSKLSLVSLPLHGALKAPLAYAVVNGRS